MFKKQKLILFLLTFCFWQLVFAQVKETKKDSSEVYNQIQTYSKKNKFTKLVHKLVFRPVNVKTKKTKVIPRGTDIKPQQQFSINDLEKNKETKKNYNKMLRG